MKITRELFNQGKQKNPHQDLVCEAIEEVIDCVNNYGDEEIDDVKHGDILAKIGEAITQTYYKDSTGSSIGEIAGWFVNRVGLNDFNQFDDEEVARLLAMTPRELLCELI